jgi:hypothetical protein
MAPTPKQLESMFLRQVPDDFLRDATRIVIDAYANAQRFCDELLAWRVAHDARPIIRRALIETNLHSLAERHPALVSGLILNEPGTASFWRAQAYKIVITESAIDRSDQLVRHADFRMSLAGRSQLTLWPEDEVRDPEACLYALLVHGPVGTESGRPEFVKIKIPASDNCAYLASIDLLERYVGVAARIETAVEVIAPTATPRLKPHLLREESER